MKPLFLRASFWEMILWLQGAPILLHFQGFHSHDPTDPVARLHDHSVSRCRKSAPYKYCLRGCYLKPAWRCSRTWAIGLQSRNVWYTTTTRGNESCTWSNQASVGDMPRKDKDIPRTSRVYPMGRSQWDPLAQRPTTAVGNFGWKPLSWLLCPRDHSYNDESQNAGWINLSIGPLTPAIFGSTFTRALSHHSVPQVPDPQPESGLHSSLSMVIKKETISHLAG